MRIVYRFLIRLRGNEFCWKWVFDFRAVVRRVQRLTTEQRFVPRLRVVFMVKGSKSSPRNNNDLRRTPDLVGQQSVLDRTNVLRRITQ